MSNLIGTIATNEGNQTSRVYDISRDISVLSPFQPLILNLALQQALPTEDVRFQWDEVDYAAVKTQINNSGGYSAAATDLVVDDATIFTVKDLARNLRTDEVYQVTAINTSTNTITVIRAIGDASGVAINDDDVLLNIGSAFEEGSTTPSANIANTSTVYNFAQIFRKVVSLTGSKARTRSTPGMGIDDISQRMADEILREIEYSFIFGKRDEDTSNFSEIRHTTNGIMNMVTTNVTSGVGTLSQTEWDTFLADKAFAKGSNEKIAICGQNYFKALSYFGQSYYRSELQMGQLGIAVSTYVSPTGEVLNLFSHELFKGDSTLAGLCIVIDPSEIFGRYTQKPTDTAMNGLIQYQEAIEANGTDAKTDQYFAEMGLMLRNEQRHAVMEGVTGPETS